MTATKQLQDRYAAAIMLTYGMPPVALARGDGCVVWDAGRQLLPGPGRRHRGQRARARAPGIVAAITEQAGRLVHTSNLYLHEPQVLLAERLIGLLGVDGRVFLANSGAEANEAAIKLVRRRQGAERPVFVAAEHSLPRTDHGRAQPDRQEFHQGSVRARSGLTFGSCPTATRTP